MKKPFNRIITIMFENQYRNYVIQNPFMKKLASAGADMTNYFGVFHPSQTNYLASFAGEICGVTNDTPPASPLLQETLVDLLEAKSVSWKAYLEGYPGDPWNPVWENPNYNEEDQPITEYPPKGGADLSRYYRKHNAFASFYNIQKDENRWNKIVGDAQFWQDVYSESLPEYSWFTPDIWNDGHYLYNTHIDTDPRTQLVPQVSAWLEHVFLGSIETSDIQGGSEIGLATIGLNLDVDLLLTDPETAWAQSNVPEGTLIVITFDEADFNAVGYDTNYDGPNQVYTVLLGDMIKPGTIISTPYNHYNLIRTIQVNYQLGSLNKNDKGANWFRFLWDETFSWDSTIDTGLAASTALALSNGSDGAHMVFSNTSNQLFDSILSSSGWSQPKELGFISSKIAMASVDGLSILVCEGDNGELLMSTYSETEKSWSGLVSLNQFTSRSFALTAYYDIDASENKLMLCWVSDNGFIQSMIGGVNGFSGVVVPVNQLTDGPMTLGQLGASLFLVYKERNSRKMRMTSYNVGSFNAFKAVDFQGNDAEENNTSLYEWSVADYPVGNFSGKMASLANEYQNLGKMAMSAVSGELHLVHRGGYADMSNAYTEVFGLTGIFTATNQLSNGYGTLNQAGWTTEHEMTEVIISPDSPLAMSTFDSKLILAWLDSKSNTIKYRTGGYDNPA